MHKFFYSITICMLHYNPRHVSSINMPIFRRTNCIITASGIVTLCKRLYSMPDESSCYAMMHGQKNIKLLLFYLLRTTHSPNLTRNYICGYIYQDFIVTTHYYIVFYHFNNS